jgi:hypothetical protein
MPRLHWPAILAGLALAIAVTLLTRALLPPIPAAVASVFGLFVSGLLAGKLAPEGPAYHGAVVGAAYVLTGALGILPAGSYLADPLADTALVIVSDVLLIAAAAAGAWSARLSFSSDRGKAR